MGIMVYALYTYHWRAASIRRGGRGPYDDRIGPVSLNVTLDLSTMDIHPLPRLSYALHCSVGFLQSK